jgi:predicted ferric reductase
MRQFRLIIVAISIVLIIVNLFYLDFRDLISKSNLGAFSGIISMIFLNLAMILSNRHEAKNKNINSRDK